MSYYAYIRVSTPRQGEEGASLAAQKSAIKHHAKRHRLTISTWFEEQESAARGRRPEFARMVRLLRRGRARGVVIHKIDRSARNLRDWAEVGELIDSGIDVQFAHEELNLASRGGRLAADIQAVVAADYIRNLREEVRKGIRARLKQGLWPSKAPYGYLDTGSGRVKLPDPIHGPTVTLAFELYQHGELSLKALSEELFQRGRRSTSGRRIRIGNLSRILKNPFYIGVLRTRAGEEFVGRHQPLVSKEVFSRVQRVLDGRGTPKRQVHDHLLRQLFRCEGCGRCLTGSRPKRYVYYGCPSGCGVSLREDRIEEVIRSRLPHLELSDELRTYVADRVAYRLSDKRRMLEDERRALAAAKARIENRLTKLLHSYLDGVIPETSYQEHSMSLQRQRLQVDRELSRTAPAPSGVPDGFFRLLRDLGQTYADAGAVHKRRLIQVLFDHRVATPEKAVMAQLRPLFQGSSAPHQSDLG